MTHSVTVYLEDVCRRYSRRLLPYGAFIVGLSSIFNNSRSHSSFVPVDCSRGIFRIHVSPEILLGLISLWFYFLISSCVVKRMVL